MFSLIKDFGVPFFSLLEYWIICSFSSWTRDLLSIFWLLGLRVSYFSSLFSYPSKKLPLFLLLSSSFMFILKKGGTNQEHSRILKKRWISITRYINFYFLVMFTQRNSFSLLHCIIHSLFLALDLNCNHILDG